MKLYGRYINVFSAAIPVKQILSSCFVWTPCTCIFSFILILLAGRSVVGVVVYLRWRCMLNTCRYFWKNSPVVVALIESSTLCCDCVEHRLVDRRVRIVGSHALLILYFISAWLYCLLEKNWLSLMLLLSMRYTTTSGNSKRLAYLTSFFDYD